MTVRGTVALPIEFTLEAMEDIADLPRVARLLSRLAEAGRIACGQPDPHTREVLIDQLRVIYRLEREQIVVLSAEPELSPFLRWRDRRRPSTH